MNKPIIIINGEPFSIFFEIFLKSFKINKNPIILICSYKLFMAHQKHLGYSFKVKLIDKDESIKVIDNKKLNIINVDFNFKKPFDKITIKSKEYIEKSFNIALQFFKNNECLGLINGPISKKYFLKGKFLGITEYLANKTKTKTEPVMLIYNNKISVCPITTHLDISDVSKKLTKKKIIEKIEIINNFYLKLFKKKIKFAVTGLNPHCESFKKDNAEKKIIIPALNFLKKKKIDVSGPFSADTVFIKKNLAKYDVIVGMYHDQVLAPIKALFGFDAINITLGLPFIRISPDHGPNNEMIGKNNSDNKSLEQSINFLKKNCGN